MFLERLDTFIAFAVVMLLLSVMVMAFVQLIVSIFGLRGRNLRWGVTLLLQEAAPDAFTEGGELDANQIAHEMLTHPALGPARNWLAMLLRWSLTKARALEALGRASPGDGPVRRAVRSLFEMIGVFRNGRRPATALDPGDVIKVLERVQREAAAAAGADPKKAKQLASLLGRGDEDGAEFVAQSKKLAERLKQQFPERAKLLEQQIETIGERGSMLATRVDEWFDTVMAATSERFKLRTRWLTAVGALVLTFGFQVDSMSIFRQLSGNSELRDALVAQATASQTLFEDLQKVAAAEAGESEGEAAEGEESEGEAAEALESKGEIPDAPDPAAAAVTSDSPEAARKRVEAAKAGLAKANELVEATGLRILDPMYATWGEFQADFAKLLPFGESPDALLGKLGDGLSGKLMTVFLLSLGAPFWYGALSKLIGLRSAVGKKGEKGKGGAGEGGGAGEQG